MTRRVRRKIIGLDFDGTCVKNKYPHIGDSIGAEHWLLHVHNTYDVHFVLWTMRTGRELDAALEWFAQLGVPLFGVNNNPDQAAWSASKKIYANVYVDDTALGMPLCSGGRKPYVDWDLAGPLLEDWCSANTSLRAKQ